MTKTDKDSAQWVIIIGGKVTDTKDTKGGDVSYEQKTMPSDDCFGQIDIKSDP
ncbi:MAG: hypothetical protein HY753_09810 [Nitrospirae bacterium]|nr:hypothetical protein [Nitrospirota bacterium]